MSIQAIFHHSGINLHKGPLQDYYPGHCDQCQMKRGGTKTIIYGMTPEYKVLLCEKCYQDLQPKILSVVTHLQNLTFYNSLPRDQNFHILNECGQLESGWHLHPKYSFYHISNNLVYLPMIQSGSNDKLFRMVPLRNLMVLNDIKL